MAQEDARDSITHEEEERHRCTARRLCELASPVREAQHDGYHHHAEPAYRTADHDGATSAHAVQEECRDEHAQGEHEVDAPSEDEREVAFKADIDLQNTSHVVPK